MDVLSSLKNNLAIGAKKESFSSSATNKSSSFSSAEKADDFSSALRTTSSEPQRQTLEKKSVDDKFSRSQSGLQKTPQSSIQERNQNPNSQIPQNVKAEQPRKDLASDQVPVKAGQEAATQDEKVDSIPRRIALQTFIRKMREDVGVEANEIMAAMASLTPEQLELPPEQNLQAILANLDLAGEQKQKAEDLFAGLIKETATNSLAEHLKTSDRELSVQVLSERELREKNMREALARMNQNFFVENRIAQPQNLEDNPASTELAEEESSDNGFFASGLGFGAAAGAVGLGAAVAGSAGASGSNAANAGTSAFSGSSSAQGMALPEGMQAVTPYTYDGNISSEMMGDTEAFSEAAGTQAASQPMKAVEQKPVENFKSLEEQLRGFKLEMQNRPVMTKQAQTAYEMAAPKNLMPQAANLSQVAPSNLSSVSAEGAMSAGAVGMGVMGGLSLMAQGEDSESQDMEGGEPFYGNQASGMEGLNKDIKTLDPSKFQVSMQPTAQEESSNIKELINQAQFLSTKGGGEMKVALSPEGLGEVIMKVSVNGGQVNVEMMAENNEAKKLLEKGIGELKSTLAGHKLNVENIKVDFQQSEISKHMEDQRGQAERQFAQDFLENFRQNNSSWRQAMNDIPGARGRSGRSDGEDRDSEIQIQRLQEKAKRSDKRLDLVA